MVMLVRYLVSCAKEVFGADNGAERFGAADVEGTDDVVVAAAKTVGPMQPTRLATTAASRNPREEAFQRELRFTAATSPV